MEFAEASASEVLRDEDPEWMQAFAPRLLRSMEVVYLQTEYRLLTRAK